MQSRVEETWGIAGNPAYWGEVLMEGTWVTVTPYYAAEEHGAAAKARAYAALGRYLDRMGEDDDLH